MPKITRTGDDVLSGPLASSAAALYSFCGAVDAHVVCEQANDVGEYAVCVLLCVDSPHHVLKVGENWHALGLVDTESFGHRLLVVVHPLDLAALGALSDALPRLFLSIRGAARPQRARRRRSRDSTHQRCPGCAGTRR